MSAENKFVPRRKDAELVTARRRRHGKKKKSPREAEPPRGLFRKASTRP
jgi:hypothetical protein